VAVRQAALVSDESALEACLRRCAIQIDDLYLFCSSRLADQEIKRMAACVKTADGAETLACICTEFCHNLFNFDQLASRFGLPVCFVQFLACTETPTSSFKASLSRVKKAF